MPKPMQVRIEPTHVDVVLQLARSPLNPRFYDRPAVFIVNELVKDSPAYKQAAAQMQSEKHPRPFKK